MKLRTITSIIITRIFKAIKEVYPTLIFIFILILSCTQSQPSNSQTPAPQSDGWILIGEKDSCKLWYKHDDETGLKYYWSVCYSSASGDVATTLVIR